RPGRHVPEPPLCWSGSAHFSPLRVSKDLLLVVRSQLRGPPAPATEWVCKGKHSCRWSPPNWVKPRCDVSRASTRQATCLSPLIFPHRGAGVKQVVWALRVSRPVPSPLALGASCESH